MSTMAQFVRNVNETASENGNVDSEPESLNFEIPIADDEHPVEQEQHENSFQFPPMYVLGSQDNAVIMSDQEADDLLLDSQPSPQRLREHNSFAPTPANSVIDLVEDSVGDNNEECEIIDLTDPQVLLEMRREVMWQCYYCKHYNDCHYEACGNCHHPKDQRLELIDVFNLVDCSTVCLEEPNEDEQHAVEQLGAETTMRKRNWFVTCNFEKNLPTALTQQVIKDFTEWISNVKDINCCIYGFESGDDEERLHVHAFVNFKSNRSSNCLMRPFAIGKYWHPNVKFLATAKDIISVIRYVAKKKTKIYGRVLNRDLFIRDDAKGYISSKLNSVKGPTQRQTDEEVFNQYEEQIRTLDWDNIPAYFSFKHGNKIVSYSEHLNKQEVVEMHPHCGLIFNCGPPGTGKTSLAKDFAEQLYEHYYMKPLNKWWDGYQGEKVVIIDDVTPEFFLQFQNELKLWTDRNAFHAEVKGSTKYINPEWVIITSNYLLPELTCAAQYRYYREAMLRRAGFGNRINHIEQPGYYLPKSAWHLLPEEQQVVYAQRFQEYCAKNSAVYQDPENPLVTA